MRDYEMGTMNAKLRHSDVQSSALVTELRLLFHSLVTHSQSQLTLHTPKRERDMSPQLTDPVSRLLPQVERRKTEEL